MFFFSTGDKYESIYDTNYIHSIQITVYKCNIVTFHCHRCPAAAGILGLRGPSLRGLNLRGASLRGPGPRGPDLRDPGLWRQISEHCFFFKHIISIPQFLKKNFLHTIDLINT